jgi:DNA-binding transcriptional LysR family regulator
MATSLPTRPYELNEATGDMAERRGTLVGPMRVSAPVTFGRMHLGPAIFPFLAKNPGIELILDLDDRRVDAAADGYDAVVRHGPLGDSRLTAWRLAPSRRLLVAAPDYLARHGGPSRDLLHEQGPRRLALLGAGGNNDCARQTSAAREQR